MADITFTQVKTLKLDLENYRTVPQKSERDSIHVMISISADRFWALMESLLEDGYHPTENIVVLKGGKEGKELVVKEGNRRVAALKIILGLVKPDEFNIPTHLLQSIGTLSSKWKNENRSVPCTIYEANEASTVERLVALTHGKGEKAGRDIWTAVARARHSRNQSGASEPGLDLLEKYLGQGKNVTPQQSERWSGDYPLTVLDEAIKKLASRLSLQSAREVADKYPKVHLRTELESVMLAIGLKQLTFPELRDGNKDFALSHGFPPVSPSTTSIPVVASSAQSKSSSGGALPSSVGAGKKASKIKSAPLNDPRAVKRLLKALTPKGKNREKVVTLLQEAVALNLEKHPLSFCFLLRSMFEISAKAYCVDHAKTGGPSDQKKGGGDKPLVDLLRDIANHLTAGQTDKQMLKALHGAMTQLASPHSILSVTSMNQLVHNPKFSVGANDISSTFCNIFPLLEALNQ